MRLWTAVTADVGGRRPVGTRRPAVRAPGKTEDGDLSSQIDSNDPPVVRANICRLNTKLTVNHRLIRHLVVELFHHEAMNLDIQSENQL